MKPYKILAILVASALILTSIVSCSDGDKQAQTIHKAVAMESGDECHLCGMLITRFDGPKGEVFRKEQKDKVFKFCSIKLLF